MAPATSVERSATPRAEEQHRALSSAPGTALQRGVLRMQLVTPGAPGLREPSLELGHPVRGRLLARDLHGPGAAKRAGVRRHQAPARVAGLPEGATASGRAAAAALHGLASQHQM